jgi:cell division inhibitor SepF
MSAPAHAHAHEADQQPSRSIFSRVKSWLNAEDVVEETQPVESTAPPTPEPHNKRQRGPLVLRTTGEQGMVIRHPRSLDDRMAIGMDLKQKRMVTLDLTRLPDSETRRYFLEFIYGVVFALDATAEKVTDGIYLLAPNGVDVNNDEHQEPELDAPAAAKVTPRTRAGRETGEGQEELFWQG